MTATYSNTEVYQNFIRESTLDLNEINCQLSVWKHDTIGSKIIHVKNDDPENVFCLSFQTFPYNDNGVAHILEHITLCASKHSK